MNNILDEITENTEDLGYKPGTPEFDKALCAAKVVRCQELQGVGICSDCRVFDYCDLIREHLLDIKFPSRRNR